jgi:subfamily B ATP-binding cassette protein MsbA
MAEPVDVQRGLLIYRRLLQYALPHWRMFAAGTLGLMVYAATDPVLAAMMKPLVDGSLIARDPQMIGLVPLLLVGVFVVRGFAAFVSTYGVRWVGRKVIARLRSEIFRQLLGLPARYYDHTSSGALLAKLTFNVEQVAQASTSAVTVLIRDTISVTLLLGYMFYVDVGLSLIFLVVGPVIAFSVRYVTQRLRRHSRRIQESVGRLSHVAEEVIEGHRVVKAFGGRETEERKFERLNEENRHLYMKLIATDAASVPLIQLLSASALAGIVYLASLASMREQISPGTFISFIGAMAMLLSPIKRLTSVNAALQKGIAASESIFALLDTEPEHNGGNRLLGRARGEIEFQRVYHAYDDEKGDVLRDINLRIEPGQTVALVGRSGSGKTSLVSLLPRFYDATEGAILMDGTEIHDLELDNLRKQIAIVGQDVQLFNDTIAANIAYGRLSRASRDEIIRAAEIAHASEFIQELPEGLETLVGEDGVLLSGGQRQRLAIARAILKDAPVLILDEATASLDSESERHIQRALQSLMRRRTTVVIAHRLSTIETADRIVVLKGGRIVEQGPHAELLARSGEYAQLHRLQFR